MHPIEPRIASNQIQNDRPLTRVCFVQSVSVLRLFATLLFASLAFQNLPLRLLACIYGFAMCSDLVDGFLARRLNMESYAGKVIDLVSDKSLTVVSLLYAAERGIYILPLALIAMREMVVIGLRLITVDGTQLLPTSRVFGGVMAFLIWSNTMYLLFVPNDSNRLQTVKHIYYGCALIVIVNLVVRIYVSRGRIMASITKAE